MDNGKVATGWFDYAANMLAGEFDQLAGAAGFDAILNPSKSRVLVCFAKLRTLG
ncbi:MAG: hypothetical protein LBK67_10560 [Coriobacteriales bacterium]|jgi:hypothetical protein|nr:hypothetical protein [Coriobacteriales bacterium]